MISIAYTKSDISPTEKNDLGLVAHQNREYIEHIGSWAKAERIVKKLIAQGNYDIFIDKYDRDNDLIDYKGYNQKT